MLTPELIKNNVILTGFDAEAILATLMVDVVGRLPTTFKPWLSIGLLSIDNFTVIDEVINWLMVAQNMSLQKGIKLLLGVVIHPCVYVDQDERLALLQRLKPFTNSIVLIDATTENSRAYALARFAQFIINITHKEGLIYFEESEVLKYAIQGVSFFTFNNQLKVRHFLKSYHFDLLMANHLPTYLRGYCLFGSWRYREDFDGLSYWEDIMMWANDFSLQLYLEGRPCIAFFPEEKPRDNYVTDLLFVNLIFDEKGTAA